MVREEDLSWGHSGDTLRLAQLARAWLLAPRASGTILCYSQSPLPNPRGAQGPQGGLWPSLLGPVGVRGPQWGRGKMGREVSLRSQSL